MFCRDWLITRHMHAGTFLSRVFTVARKYSLACLGRSAGGAVLLWSHDLMHAHVWGEPLHCGAPCQWVTFSPQAIFDAPTNLDAAISACVLDWPVRSRILPGLVRREQQRTIAALR